MHDTSLQLTSYNKRQSIVKYKWSKLCIANDKETRLGSNINV